HRVLATDIFLDGEDGLGAFDRYRQLLANGVERAQADMEALPLADAQFDLVVAAGAIHYVRDVALPVAEAYRLLREQGLFLVLDSPVYRRPDDGRAMVSRRVREHWRTYGVSPAPELQSGFLLLPDFVRLLRQTGFAVDLRHPFDGVERTVRRWLAQRLARPIPAVFTVFVASKPGAERSRWEQER
ncbi:MAG: class I SAM-dependent methyltransferase, partial [Acidobacteriota bacterium]